MNAEDIRTYCIAKHDVTEGFPFDEQTLVFKTNGKMFLLVSLDSSPVRFNAKCDPDRAMQLREEYAAILPGYHMNKQHWNTVIADGTLPNKLLKELIDHSYDLIAKSKKTKKSTNGK